MTETLHNTKLYLELCLPKESVDKANADVAEFFRELRELREKYGLPDVLCIISCFVYYGSEVGHVTTLTHNGNELEAEPMLAYALGSVQAERRARINQALAGKETP